MPKSEDDYNREALEAELARASHRMPDDGVGTTMEQQSLRLVSCLFTLPYAADENEERAIRVRALWDAARKQGDDITTWDEDSLILFIGGLSTIQDIVFTSLLAISAIQHLRKNQSDYN